MARLGRTVDQQTLEIKPCTAVKELMKGKVSVTVACATRLHVILRRFL